MTIEALFFSHNTNYNVTLLNK